MESLTTSRRYKLIYGTAWMRGAATGALSAAVGVALGLFFSGCGYEPVYLVGSKGDPGDRGEQGTSGTDATPVTAVKLCPAESSYPSTFVEYAYCIQNRLYATYSANGGFSTYLPPGTYNSNAVGSSCTFTVTEGCQISN